MNRISLSSSSSSSFWAGRAVCLHKSKRTRDRQQPAESSAGFLFLRKVGREADAASLLKKSPGLKPGAGVRIPHLPPREVGTLAGPTVSKTVMGEKLHCGFNSVLSAKFRSQRCCTQILRKNRPRARAGFDPATGRKAGVNCTACSLRFSSETWQSGHSAALEAGSPRGVAGSNLAVSAKFGRLVHWQVRSS